MRDKVTLVLHLIHSCPAPGSLWEWGWELRLYYLISMAHKSNSPWRSACMCVRAQGGAAVHWEHALSLLFLRCHFAILPCIHASKGWAISMIVFSHWCVSLKQNLYLRLLTDYILLKFLESFLQVYHCLLQLYVLNHSSELQCLT